MLTRGSSVGVVGRLLPVTLVASFLTSGLGLTVTAPAPARAADAPVRVLSVGDSLTQAHAGEYSWRRFAWQQWRRDDVAVDMVGPWRAPAVEPGGVGPALYADADFDQDHAGVWGARASFAPVHDVASLVRTHRPDVVVLALGTNDLTWLQVRPVAVVAALATMVEAARGAAPGVDVVLPEVVAPRTPVIAEHNRLLAEYAVGATTPDSRVVVARTSVGFTPGTDAAPVGDTYDALHPNARGQAKYAAAVVDAFARLGVGRAHPRPVTTPPEGPRSRPRASAVGGPSRVDLRWVRPPGTTSTDVWIRRPSGPWRLRGRAVPFDATSLHGLTNCRVYEVRAAARRGWTRQASDRWSRPVRVRAGGRVAGVVGLRGRIAGRTVRARWSADPSACSYRVRIVRPGKDRVLTVTDTSVRVEVGKRTKGKVLVRVRAVGAVNSGATRSVRLR